MRPAARGVSSGGESSGAVVPTKQFAGNARHTRARSSRCRACASAAPAHPRCSPGSPVPPCHSAPPARRWRRRRRPPRAQRLAHAPRRCRRPAPSLAPSSRRAAPPPSPPAPPRARIRTLCAGAAARACAAPRHLAPYPHPHLPMWAVRSAGSAGRCATATRSSCPWRPRRRRPACSPSRRVRCRA
jgi:hypothetical protein